ncbi:MULTISPECIES: helix-turn-helix domain-containing protein [Acidithiobacillus]|uniref:helix-turn-helix domain-containing protein n=1 Tax=Acidithiobacillus TaxID=119977 RepID=UPI00094B1DA7|nr:MULTISPECIES: helix-turn-helix domain-containing protein [Acidithiobacillus]MBE7564120.1 helix-turn-helix domain-containing protein [Acidithiobacillus sp. HP-6]MBE7570863.1 helix-turn-helix domain-containing protein [Acidithiobacillus sp. HP-2]
MDNQALQTIARNIQTIRGKSGLTLSGLAQHSGIAKSTLSLLERGQGNPTIETVWAIANALNVPFSHIIDGVEAVKSFSEDGDQDREKVRFVERYGTNPQIEVYEMTIAEGHSRVSSAHPPGVFERVIALRGEMYVGNETDGTLLRPGQSHAFAGDSEHTYTALNGPSTALVLIEYREHNTQSDRYKLIRGYPQSAAEWEGLRSLVDRAMIDVTHGVSGFYLELRGSNSDIVVAENHLGFHSSGFQWPLLIFTGKNDQGLWIAVLPQNFVNAFTLRMDHLGDAVPDVLLSAIRLAATAEQMPGMVDSDVMLLEPVTKSSTLVLATLAYEVALQHGYLLIPRQWLSLAQRDVDIPSDASGEDFSSRINVDYYTTFELLHPAYARQVTALAEDVLTFDPQGGKGLFIDVGSGPGTALFMLMELLPEARATALEPDCAAFAYLLNNTKGLAQLRCVQEDFLIFDKPDEPVSVITSVGSSHHFNTAFMLQKAWQLLVKNGILCIADELLPRFTDLESRNNALIRHHVAYVLSSMAKVDVLNMEGNDSTEIHIYQYIREKLIHAFMLSIQNQTSTAVKYCRNLFEYINQRIVSKNSSSDIGALVRFYVLEIQAMVAGFDYEIERKTYPKKLVSLAYGAGFELLNHRRIFATTGIDEWEGGTHVFTFRKRERSRFEEL